MKRLKKPDDLCVTLDKIGDSGYHCSCVRHKSWVVESLGEVKDIDFGCEEDITIGVDFFKAGATVMVRGSISTTLGLRCVRCLESFRRPLEIRFHYNLLPEQKRDLPPEMEIPREEFDSYYYSGSDIDLAPLILEQVVLNIPTHPLCSDSCKGICQQCGADLNHTTCRCTGESAVSPFAALKNFAPSPEKKN